MYSTGLPVSAFLSSVRHRKKQDIKAYRKGVHIKIHNSCGLLFLLHCFPLPNTEGKGVN